MLHRCLKSIITTRSCWLVVWIKLIIIWHWCHWWWVRRFNWLNWLLLNNIWFLPLLSSRCWFSNLLRFFVLILDLLPSIVLRGFVWSCCFLVWRKPGFIFRIRVCVYRSWYWRRHTRWFSSMHNFLPMNMVTGWWLHKRISLLLRFFKLWRCNLWRIYNFQFHWILKSSSFLKSFWQSRRRIEIWINWYLIITNRFWFASSLPHFLFPK